MPEITFDDAEVFGEADESGRPANIPEKYFKPGEGEDGPTVDFAGLLTEYNYRGKQIGAADGIIGAPPEGEDYAVPEVEVPEGVDYKLTPDDPMLKGFTEFARSKNLSQKGFNDVVGWFAEQRIAEMQGAQEAMKAELDKIAPNGEGAKQVALMTQQMENMLKGVPEAERNQLMEGFKEAVVSADTFKFMQHIINRMQPGALPAGDGGETAGDSLDQVREMQNERYTEGPNKGKRKFDIDPSYREKVRAARAAVVGDGPAKREVISLKK